MEQRHREVIEDWIHRYGDKVLRLCFLWLRDVQLAEDAMQETFLKAWRALPTYREQEGASPLAFLSTIAVNTCKDQRRGFWFTRVNRALALEDLPEQKTAVSDEDRDLFLTVTALPEKLSQIIILYYYTGLNLRECAQALNIQASSAHNRLKKAEACLRKELEGGIANEREICKSYR